MMEVDSDENESAMQVSPIKTRSPNHRFLRARAIEEIISSERSYIAHLETIKKFWMKPLECSPLMSGKVWSLMFGNLDELLSVNKYLLQQIQGKPECLGQTFSQLAPFLKIYCGYARDFRSAIRALEHLTATNKRFAAFRKNQESRPEVSQSLEALLITPIQRITRYPLLISELVAHTSSAHSDFEKLSKAREQLLSVAQKLNDTVKEQENFFMIRCIQACLNHSRPKVVVTGRKFIKEGVLLKLSSRGPLERAFFLFNDALLYCKPVGLYRLRVGDRQPSGVGSGKLQCSGFFPLKYVGVEKILGNPQVGQGVLFKITYGAGRSIEVMSNSVHDGYSWMEAISAASAKVMEKRATLRRNTLSVYNLRGRRGRVYVKQSKEEQERALKRQRRNSNREQALDRIASMMKSITPKRRKRKASEDLDVALANEEHETASACSSGYSSIDDTDREYLSASELESIHSDSDLDMSCSPKMIIDSGDEDYVTVIQGNKRYASEDEAPDTPTMPTFLVAKRICTPTSLAVGTMNQSENWLSD